MRMARMDAAWDALASGEVVKVLVEVRLAEVVGNKGVMSLVFDSLSSSFGSVRELKLDDDARGVSESTCTIEEWRDRWWRCWWGPLPSSGGSSGETVGVTPHNCCNRWSSVVTSISFWLKNALTLSVSLCRQVRGSESQLGGR